MGRSWCMLIALGLQGLVRQVGQPRQWYEGGMRHIEGPRRPRSGAPIRLWTGSHRGRAADLGALLRALLAVLVLAGGLGVLASGTAQADEVWTRPASGVWTLSGHGFGHGRGMSQWGAAGAAGQGVSSADILSFYYPGTTRTSVPNDVLRVNLSGVDSASLRVSQTVGLAVVESTGVRTELPADRSQWRLVPSGTGLQLQGQLAGVWAAYPLGGLNSVPAPVRFEAPAAMLRLWRADGSSVDYRGAAAAHLSGTAVTTVLSVPLESYLRGVVPSESPASWPAAALEAQAVAARSYAVSAMRRNAANTWHICDTTACQVFNGTTRYSPAGASTKVEYASTDAAIAATAGAVLTYQGAIAFTEFSASNGGWTAAGGVPYQVAKPDPWDGTAPGDSVHSWTASLPVATLEARYPSVGSVTRLVVTSRDGKGDWGGRVLTLRLEGSAGSVTLTGNDIRNARPYPTYSDGVRSNWFFASDREPMGVIDSIAAVDGATVSLHGWALDSDTTASVSVRVTVDGVSGYSGIADQPRPDVGAAYPGSGDAHGMSARLTVGGGPHTVCVEALNVGPNGPGWARIGCRSFAMPGPTMPAVVVAGGRVVSPSGRFWLSMQPDGNLVAYETGGRVQWATMTNVPGSVVRAQPDGNVVVYDAQGLPVWTAGIYSPGARVVLQDDGNLVVYSSAGTPLWDSAGVLGRTGIWFVPKRIVTGLASGSSAVSNDGRHVLTMDSGGDLTVTTGGTLRWHAGSGTPGSVLRAQPDGNAVVYRPDGSAAWHSVVYSPGAVLVVQDDGNVVVYSPSGRALWDAMGFTGNRGRLLGP